KAAVCVFPSHMESQGLVSLEAMLLEKPVIFSKYGPGPETINHQEDGLLADVYQPEDIADKIRWVLNNREQADAMGKRARQAVKARFDLQKVTAQNVAFYRSIQ
ncbi:glycosyltransferase family 4 protein, partial [Gilvibacter sp.]|uniref:glycosyltransferase family 4 protein n=1 Tax=Gilvibacter sp. TaxID=2729997 RepID=UPI0025B80BBD